MTHPAMIIPMSVTSLSGEFGSPLAITSPFVKPYRRKRHANLPACSYTARGVYSLVTPCLLTKVKTTTSGFVSAHCRMDATTVSISRCCLSLGTWTRAYQSYVVISGERNIQESEYFLDTTRTGMKVKMTKGFMSHLDSIHILDIHLVRRICNR